MHISKENEFLPLKQALVSNMDCRYEHQQYGTHFQEYIYKIL